MTRLTRRSATLLAVVVACALPLGSAQAGAPTTQNIASAVIQQDEGRAFDVAWDLSRQRGIDVVDHHNEAFARASCVRCHATAIAFQIVLVSGTPTPRVVAPANVADAQNIACTECVAIAEARQFVRVVPADARISGAGRAVLDDVRDRLEALPGRNLPLDALHLEVEAQEARVRQVLNTELVLRSDPRTEAATLGQRLLQDADLG